MTKVRKRWVRDGGIRKLEFSIVQITPADVDRLYAIFDTRDRTDLTTEAELLAQTLYNELVEVAG